MKSRELTGQKLPWLPSSSNLRAYIQALLFLSRPDATCMQTNGTVRSYCTKEAHHSVSFLYPKRTFGQKKVVSWSFQPFSSNTIKKNTTGYAMWSTCNFMDQPTAIFNTIGDMHFSALPTVMCNGICYAHRAFQGFANCKNWQCCLQCSNTKQKHAQAFPLKQCPGFQLKCAGRTGSHHCELWCSEDVMWWCVDNVV